MGRTASITRNDVAEARETLRAAGQAHGIIAIRKHLGRGSPQLIGRFLRELDGQPLRVVADSAAEPIASAVASILTLLSQEIADTLERSARVPSAATGAAVQWPQGEDRAGESRPDLAALEQRALTAEAENTVLRDTVESLHREMDAQRDSFRAWRREDVRERAFLASRIERLTNALTTPGRDSARRTGGAKDAQLDLYGSGDTAE